MCAVAYFLLETALITQHGKDSDFARALKKSGKDLASVTAYVIALGFALFQPWISLGLVAAVAVVWIVPDRRFAPAKEPQ